eukprot:365664-Chlamydomonas_euryale.AAC.4
MHRAECCAMQHARWCAMHDACVQRARQCRGQAHVLNLCRALRPHPFPTLSHPLSQHAVPTLCAQTLCPRPVPTPKLQ